LNFDILIRNGKLIDGAGNPWFKADVGIKNQKIKKIGRLIKATATKELDASNMIVCPGFIDIHSHSDFAIAFENKCESTIRQGITTLVVGHCGDSLAPAHPDKKDVLKKLIEIFLPPGKELNITWHWFKEYLEAMDRLSTASNVVPLVGFAAVRIAGGPGYEDRVPTTVEMESMKNYVTEAMEAGAYGFSTGLVYSPQVYSTTEEVIELAKVAAKYGGIYFTHLRGEGATVVKAVEEAIEITEKSGCIRGQIAHHKIAGTPYWGLSKKTLRLMEKANARGLDISCDQYPYTRGLSSLITILPPWVHKGGILRIVERLQVTDNRERVKKEISDGIEGWENWGRDVGFDRIYIASVKTNANKDIIGKSISEITQIKGKLDDYTTLFDLLIEENGAIMMTMESMGEDDLRQIMTGRFTMIGTDGWSISPTGAYSQITPHPRFYGTMPRVLGKYVREEKVLTFETAIRKMTSFPAQKLRIWDRGLLRESFKADIVVFNPDTVRDKATYENPHQFNEGIIHVLVNGEIVVENEQQTDKLPGKYLRRPI